jgi:hypothetical protein
MGEKKMAGRKGKLIVRFDNSDKANKSRRTNGTRQKFSRATYQRSNLKTTVVSSNTLFGEQLATAIGHS